MRPFVADDVPTACAIAVVAVCTTTCAHEAMGHGDACALLSGHITQLTSVYFQCSLHSQFIAPAGPAGNYLAGCVAWLAGMALPPGAVRARLYALLVMAFSFFWEAGYLIFAMATGHGDYVYAAQDFLGGPAWIWRAGGILLGIALYRLFGHFLGARLRAFGRAEGTSGVCFPQPGQRRS